ncbi:MAG: phospholipase D-like domain-containing protein [Gammaproteobacteria bacterium]|nr:phospholipase D-like domain-containing protein [Gammaproteobacteria bacterium]
MILLESVVIFFLYVLGIVGAIHALMKKREPRSALIWVIICVFFPFFGVLLYIMFGVNRVKMVMREWRSHGICSLTAAEKQMAEDEVDQRQDYEAYYALMKTGYQLLRQPLQIGCQVDCLFDGVQAYPEMIKAIRSAESCVFLSTYIFGSTGVGTEFIEALSDAVQRKVEVKVLIDGVGSLYTWPSIYWALKKNRVPVHLFLFPLSSIRGLRYLNLRNHTKLLVVDGKVAFTGGMNIHADNDAKRGVEPFIHDLHFKLQGPILGELQDVFLNIWYFATGWKQHPRLLFYDDTMKGNALTRGIANGPYQDIPSIQIMLNTAINQAQSYIRIMTPYFIMRRRLYCLPYCSGG